MSVRELEGFAVEAFDNAIQPNANLHWAIDKESDVKVFLRTWDDAGNPKLKEIKSGYTVAKNDPIVGGIYAAVTMNLWEPQPGDYELYAVRDTSRDQNADFTRASINSNSYSDMLNKALDKLTMQTQELADSSLRISIDDRAPKAPGEKSIDITLPPLKNQKGKVVTVNNDESGFEFEDLPAEQVNADWNATSGKAEILHKPTIPSPYSLPTASQNVKGGVKVGDGLTMTGEVLSANGDSYWKINNSNELINSKYSLPVVITNGMEENNFYLNTARIGDDLTGGVITFESFSYPYYDYILAPIKLKNNYNLNYKEGNLRIIRDDPYSVFNIAVYNYSSNTFEPVLPQVVFPLDSIITEMNLDGGNADLIEKFLSHIYVSQSIIGNNVAKLSIRNGNVQIARSADSSNPGVLKDVATVDQIPTSDFSWKIGGADPIKVLVPTDLTKNFKVSKNANGRSFNIEAVNNPQIAQPSPLSPKPAVAQFKTEIVEGTKRATFTSSITENEDPKIDMISSASVFSSGLIVTPQETELRSQKYVPSPGSNIVSSLFVGNDKVEISKNSGPRKEIAAVYKASVPTPYNFTQLSSGADLSGLTITFNPGPYTTPSTIPGTAPIMTFQNGKSLNLYDGKTQAVLGIGDFGASRPDGNGSIAYSGTAPPGTWYGSSSSQVVFPAGSIVTANDSLSQEFAVLSALQNCFVSIPTEQTIDIEWLYNKVMGIS